MSNVEAFWRNEAQPNDPAETLLLVPRGELRELLNVIDTLRVKVAELEARIAEIHEALGENAGSDDASLATSIRWTLADHRNALEESEAALARANEALRAHLDRLRARMPVGFDSLEAWTDEALERPGNADILADAKATKLAIDALGAQGSAAQKTEGPDGH